LEWQYVTLILSFLFSQRIVNTKQSKTLYEQRGRLGLCFKCGEKSMIGHHCSVEIWHMMEGLDEEKKKFL
jgi:hypothetical protein